MADSNNKKKVKSIPAFKTEDEEREFWDNEDASEYFDLDSAVKAKFPNLKYSTESISIRLPSSLLNDIKIMANKRDVTYQSLIKMMLAEVVAEESVKYKVKPKKK